jgi:twitching motility protein PilT
MVDDRLGILLVDGGFVDEMQLERCLRIQAATGRSRPLGQILVEHGAIDAGTLQRVMALQARRGELRAASEPATDTRSRELLRAAEANGASELVVSEGRSVRIRVAGVWRELTQEPIAGPEAWDFVREVMGAAVLEELADRHCVTKHAAVGATPIVATAFRQLDGVAVRVSFVGAPATDAKGAVVPAVLLQQAERGAGLILLVTDRREPRVWPMRPLLAAALSVAGRHGVALCDEPLGLGTTPGLLTLRRLGLRPEQRAEALRSALRTGPDVLAIADVGSPETFDLALGAAAGGALVVACIDAASVFGALQRVLDFYPAHEVPRVRATLAEALRAVLVRCVLPDAERNGSVVATELLLVDGPAREVLRSGELGDLRLLMRAADGRCGWPLDHSLLELLTAGRTRVEDVFPRAEEKARFLARSRSAALVSPSSEI